MSRRLDQTKPMQEIRANAGVVGYIQNGVEFRANGEPVKAEPLPVKGQDFPRHKGGGNYELSDGSSVKGKKAAIKAQADIDAEA